MATSHYSSNAKDFTKDNYYKQLACWLACPQELNSKHRDQYQTEINNEYLSSLPVVFSDCFKVSAINHRTVTINDKTQSKP